MLNQFLRVGSPLAFLWVAGIFLHFSGWASRVHFFGSVESFDISLGGVAVDISLGGVQPADSDRLDQAARLGVDAPITKKNSRNDITLHMLCDNISCVTV